MIRSFVAIPLPSEVVDGLGAAIHSLQELGLEGRGVRAAALHLTLKFLGNVHAELLKSVGPVLHRVAGHTCPFELILRGANAFPRRTAARVVFVDLRRSPSLDALRDAIEEALHDLGVPKVAREYRPHLALIRLRSQRRLSRLQDWFKRQHKIQNRSFRVSHFNMYESVLKAGAVRY